LSIVNHLKIGSGLNNHVIYYSLSTWEESTKRSESRSHVNKRPHRSYDLSSNDLILYNSLRSFRRLKHHMTSIAYWT